MATYWQPEHVEYFIQNISNEDDPSCIHVIEYPSSLQGCLCCISEREAAKSSGRYF